VLFSLLFQINGIYVDKPPRRTASGETSKEWDDFDYKGMP